MSFTDDELRGMITKIYNYPYDYLDLNTCVRQLAQVLLEERMAYNRIKLAYSGIKTYINEQKQALIIVGELVRVLAKAILDAPHDPGCEGWGGEWGEDWYGPCDCWKAAVIDLAKVVAV
jgi:hypothetical protein